MTNKRSFFERFTGAVRLNEDSGTEESVNIIPNHAVSTTDDEEEGQLSVDVYETSSEIIIKTMVAGVKPEDLDVTITRDSVTIRGKREEDRTLNIEDYIHRELYWGTFSRIIPLPEEIDVEESEAVEKYGLLMLHLPKIDKNRKTKLKVRGQ